MSLIMLLAMLAVITLPSIIWLYALADAAVNSFRTFGAKIIWILLLCFFPPIGTLLYYLFGRGQRRTRYPVGKFVLVCILVFPILMTIGYYLQSPSVKYPDPAPAAPSKSIQI